MEPRADSADGGNTISCKVSYEHHGGALPERIDHGHVVLLAGYGQQVPARRG